MLIRQLLDSGQTVFEGDRSLSLSQLPEGARVRSARVHVTPIDGVAPDLFTEHIQFAGERGDFGATRRSGADAVEVDFHARRTLLAVRGANLDNATLQVDIGGGVFVEIADDGTIASSGDNAFSLPGDDGPPARLVRTLA